MILIWKGAGILIAMIWFFSLFAGDWLAKMLFGEDVSNGLCNLTGEWLAAFLSLGLALLLRLDRQVILDPDSNQMISVRGRHSLFFIPAIAWPVIFFILGIVAYREEVTRPPALVEVTPTAEAKAKLLAAEKGLQYDWYIHIEAYWPKGAPSPLHKLAIGQGPVGDREHQFKSGKIKIVVPKRQLKMFPGAQLDFKGKDLEEGFVVNNPNFEKDQVEKHRRTLELDRPSDPE
ncbi:iron-sulfur cluster assembly accessory protein [Zavarzinella formosa]|uniref:hypothetical protein n=1 Tax=Zavarzinella formosa TaxID=360055 RepID=UPI0002FC7817|nr:hypothetical protein [Zavarzinella formosa]